MSVNIKKSLSLILTVITLISCLSLGLVASAVGTVASFKATKATVNSIALSWSKVANADGYRLYKYNTEKKKWGVLKTTTSTNYTDSKLSAGTSHTYRVRAYEVVDGERVYGKLTASLKVLTLPGETKNLKATKINADNITLSWNKADGAKRYAVYQYNTSKKKYSRIATTASTSYTVKSLKSSTSYKFAVRAYVKDKTVAYGKTSNYLTVKTLGPNDLTMVENLCLDSISSTSYKLRWDAVKGAEGYQIAIFNESTGKWKSLGRTTKTAKTITAKDTTATYLHRVRAYKKQNGSNVYGALSEPVEAFAKPAIPTGLEGAENSDYGISLRWNKVKGADGYEIYTYDAVNGKWVAVAATIKNSYNVKGLTETSHYKYKVRACKVSGGKRFSGDFCESITVSFQAAENNSIYSEEMEKSGVFGYLYDPKGKYFFTADDPWQRNVGYNSIFDSTSNIALIDFDTVRLRFPYKDKDWMIQVWKGQYGLIFYGAELGVYTKPKDRKLMHYDCASDSEMLRMSMVFNEKRGGVWQQRFTRPYGYYWWCTGFLPGNKLGDYSGISLDIRITAKDYDMLAGIKSALESNNLSYTASGLNVYFTFN